MNIPDIRETKPGYDERYYVLREHLGDYTAAVIDHLHLPASAGEALLGETGVVVELFGGHRPSALKFSPFDGDLFASAYFYEQVRDTGVPVPHVLQYDDTHTVVPVDFQLMEFIPGRAVRELPAALHRQAGVHLGTALRRIHRMEVEGFGAPLPSGSWSAATWLQALRGYYGPEIERARRLVFSESEVRGIEALTWDNARLEISKPMLMHGDVGEGNALYVTSVDGLRLAGLIDPGGIIGGDPLFDLASGTNDEGPFAEGIRDGYTRLAALSTEERYRERCLRLFSCYWTACWQRATSRDFRQKQAQTRQLLASLQ